MPTATDLVTDLPADFEVFGQAVATSMADLLGGTTGQILSKTSATDMDFTWITNDVGDITAVTAGTGISGGGTSGAVTITNSMATEITAKGDLIAGTGSATFDNLPVGTNGQTLVADSSTATGLKWATPAASTPTFVGCSVYKSAAHGSQCQASNGGIKQASTALAVAACATTTTAASTKPPSPSACWPSRRIRRSRSITVRTAARKAGSSSAQRSWAVVNISLLLDAFEGEGHGDLIADAGDALDPEIAALHGEIGGEADAVAAPGILAFTDLGHGEGHRLGRAREGQVAGDGEGLAIRRGERLRDEGQFGELLRVEEVGRAQVLVALLREGVDRFGLDRNLDRGLGRFGGVPGQGPVDRIEAAVGVADPEVADAEQRGRVGSIDTVGIGGGQGQGAEGGEQGRGEEVAHGVVLSGFPEVFQEGDEGLAFIW